MSAAWCMTLALRYFWKVFWHDGNTYKDAIIVSTGLRAGRWRYFVQGIRIVRIALVHRSQHRPWLTKFLAKGLIRV